jgi:hypothetical protein
MDFSTGFLKPVEISISALKFTKFDNKVSLSNFLLDDSNNNDDDKDLEIDLCTHTYTYTHTHTHTHVRTGS